MSHIHVGFTGTRNGCTPEQLKTLKFLLEEIKNKYKECWFHSGDCVGADSEANTLANSLGYVTWIHPPVDDKLRAYGKAHHILEPRTYFARNRDIVNDCISIR